MKISQIKIHGIKSYEDVVINMEDYTVFVGENNCGKSNVLFALLWFFGKEKLSVKDLNINISDNPYIDIEFKLVEDEIFSHPIEYRVENKFKVRATIDRAKAMEKPMACEYFGYTGKQEDSMKDSKLMGFKNVARPSLGDLIYVPSIKSLSDELKFTTSSALNQLVSKYVINRIKDEDGKANHYSQIVNSIKQLSDYINEGEHSALQTLKRDISRYMLDYGNISLGFELEPPNAEDLIKSCFKQHTDVDGGNKLPLSSQGDGFQRSMIFSLIANLAEVGKTNSSKKTAKNECTYYIIEEPEIFLHPNHQLYFRNKLEELSRIKDSQVIITSHSPYFLNNINNYSQIKRVYLEGAKSLIGQIDKDEIDSICLSNGRLLAEAKNECKVDKLNSLQLEVLANKIAKEDHLRYLLWIDPTRANAFLSKKVILVEGPSEKALFSFLFNNPKGNFYDEKRTASITVIDVVGKFHIYKFAQLLNRFKIKTWCLYDGDNDKCKSGGISHGKLNEAIEELKNSSIIIDTLRLDPDIEQLLGLSKDLDKPDVALYMNLENNTNKCIECDGFKKLVDFTKSIIIA